MSIIPSTNTGNFVNVANLMARLSESGLDRQLQTRQQVAALQEQGLDRLQSGNQIRANRGNARQQAVNMLTQNLTQSAIAAAERAQQQKEAELQRQLQRELQQGNLTAEREAQLIQQAGFDSRNQMQANIAANREQGLTERQQAQLNQQLRLANQSDNMQLRLQEDQQQFSAEQNKLNREAQALRDKISNDLQIEGMDQRRADAAADRMLRAVLQLNQQQFQANQMAADQEFRREMFGAEQTREQELLDQERQTQLIGDTREIANMDPKEQKTLLLAMPEEDRKAVLGNLLAPKLNEFEATLAELADGATPNNADTKKAFDSVGFKDTLELIKTVEPAMAEDVKALVELGSKAGATNIFKGMINQVIAGLQFGGARHLFTDFNPAETIRRNTPNAILGRSTQDPQQVINNLRQTLGLNR